MEYLRPPALCTITNEEGRSLANCVTCGDALHTERAAKYDYCTKPECQDRNTRGLRIAAVGVNKAADQYVILDERAEQEMASGRYKSEPDVQGSSHGRPRAGRVRTPSTAPVLVPRSSATPSRPRWSEAQENLALIYRDMGMKPDDIAKKLGVSPYVVTQILLAAS
jgi:hypothetical protein